jgi:DNA-binding NtrC family response regulator
MSKVKAMIWAVDDEPSFLATVKHRLNEQNIEVSTFEKHEVFFEKLNPEVDIVLIDVNMPNFEIVAGIKRIYSVKKEIKILLMTYKVDLDLSIALLNGGLIFRYIKKGLFGEENNIVYHDGAFHNLDCYMAMSAFIEHAKEAIKIDGYVNLIANG